MATKQNSGLPRPRDSLPQLAAICFARAPAASGEGKGARSAANPGGAKRRALHGREKQRSVSDCANPGDAKRRALHGREKQRSASDCANPGGAPPARRNPGEGFIMIRIGKSPKAVRPGAS